MRVPKGCLQQSSLCLLPVFLDRLLLTPRTSIFSFSASVLIRVQQAERVPIVLKARGCREGSPTKSCGGKHHYGSGRNGLTHMTSRAWVFAFNLIISATRGFYSFGGLPRFHPWLSIRMLAVRENL